MDRGTAFAVKSKFVAIIPSIDLYAIKEVKHG